MATSTKRKHESDGGTGSAKKVTLEQSNSSSRSRSSENDVKLESFIKWCQECNFQLSSKVTVKRDGSCAQYGMHAAEDIAEGYCLFQVPRSMLLMPVNTDIAEALEKDTTIHEASNQWIPLLLSLLYEHCKADSKWLPYLNIAPDDDAIDLPMFWEKNIVDKLLTGTGVVQAVERDLKMIESDFANYVCPFVQRHKEKFSGKKIDLTAFKRMVAFVMAYSFTEPASKGSEKGDSERAHSDEESEEEEEEEEEKMQPPMMVPLADTLNHVTHHNAKLTFGKEALKMVTTRFIKKGEEIYNTYGQVSNLHLMHMYGFAEPYPDNTSDVVEIPASHLLTATKETHVDDMNALKLVDKKWELLKNQEIIEDEDIIVLGKEGIINDDVCHQVLKVLCMSPSEFNKYVEDEGWSDAESESSTAEDNSSLNLSKCSQLGTPHKNLLKRMCELHLQSYPLTISEAERKIETTAWLPTREKYALYTSHGQQLLLGRMINELTS